MIKSINVITLVGNVVEAPQLRKAGDIDVTTVRLAVNNSEKDTLFINCECWRNNATFASQYFQKGSLVGVVGTLKQKEFTNKDGVKMKDTYVEVEGVNFVGGKKESDGEKVDSAPKTKQEPAKAKTVTAKQAPKSEEDGLPF